MHPEYTDAEHHDRFYEYLIENDEEGLRHRLDEYWLQWKHDDDRRNARKRRRLSAAVSKDCSECGKDMPHDLDDYKCIVCRDGHDALPA